MNIKLIVGLSNPGKLYEFTRHNAGAWWIQAICHEYSIHLKQLMNLKANIGKTNINGYTLYCAIPNTYINNSGEALIKISKYFNISLDEILIVHDEIQFNVGIMRLKTGGGHNGHNGVRNIILQLGANNFHRLRIGIGYPGNLNISYADYVLSKPSHNDKKLIDNAITNSMSLLPIMLSSDWQLAKNILHKN